MKLSECMSVQNVLIVYYLFLFPRGFKHMNMGFLQCIVRAC